MTHFLDLKNNMECILEENASVTICHECRDVSLSFNASLELWAQMKELVQNQVYANYGELIKEGIKRVLRDLE